MAKKPAVKKRRYTSRDAFLDQAIDRLEYIDSGSHKDTALYQGVMDSIQRLHTITSRFYDSPIKTDTDLMQIRAAYEDVRAACDSYLEKNSGLHLHLYKKQREHGIRAIRDIVDRDLFAMDPEHHAFDPSKNLKELLESARKSTVSVDDPAAIRSVGGSASTRIPIAMKGESGEERGFFTERSHAETEDEIAKRINDRYRKKLAPGLDTDDLTDVYTPVQKLCNYSSFNRDRETDCASVEDFLPVYRDVLRTLYGSSASDELLKKKIQSREAREAIFDLCKDSYQSIRQHDFNHDIAEIDEGRPIETRNVAMSRMADLFGMEGLIARSETMDLRVGDRTVSGVFMRTAEGADLSLAKKGDPLDAVFTDEKSLMQGMDSAHVKCQLADLQVLDYLCGNTDRHERNLIYQMGKDQHGNPCVTGITGIDNDLSFGKIQGAKGAMVPPDSIRIMTRATYDTIMGMTPQALSTQLADLGLDAKEQQAAVARLNALKARLDPANVVMSRPDMPTDLQYQSARNGIRFDPAHPNDLQYAQRGNPNPVLVVQDETGFDSISFETLARGSDKSMFGQLAAAPESLRASGLLGKDKEPRGIQYAGATRIGAFVDRVVKKYGVRKSLRELRALSDADAAREKAEKSAGAAARKQQRKQAAAPDPAASAQKGTVTV
ncbi:MAG: hypothetical protein K6B72_00580 [Lachnospiraceae bacterium]|nr:hypothetical protein [Lachnospiraceae bacterium]